VKALTLWQPWAGFVAAGMKRIETRSWPTKYRGEVAIHAGMKLTPWAKDFPPHILRGLLEADPDGKLRHYGSILAVATLSDCIRTQDLVCLDDRERLLGNYEPGRWAWRLESVIVLDNPVPCRGMQGLWTVPPEIEKKIYDEMPIPF
jgi:hypothetical protein